MLFHENIETILVFVVRFYYVVALLKSMVGWEGLSYNEIKKVEAKENHSWDNQYNFFTHKFFKGILLNNLYYVGFTSLSLWSSNSRFGWCCTIKKKLQMP